MKKLDARKLTPEIQQHNRDLAIWLFQQGKKRANIAELVGAHYGVACCWIRAWEHGGEKAIKQGQRGRRPKEQRLLRAAQETVLKKLICDKNPDQMKLPFALWNRKAIQAVVKQMCSIRIAIRTITDYLKRWGCTPLRSQQSEPMNVNQR